MHARTRFRCLSLLLVATALASGCAHAQAKVVLETPSLDVPQPPARVIEAMNVEAPPPVGSPESLPSGIDGLNRSEPPRPARASQPRVEAPKPVETPKADAAVATDLPKPPEEPRAQVASPLQSAPTQREGEVEAAIRADIRRATDKLNRVDYRLLTADARTQYDGAKTLILLAEDALRARNLVFAKSLSEKAGTLATQLAGR